VTQMCRLVLAPISCLGGAHARAKHCQQAPNAHYLQLGLAKAPVHERAAAQTVSRRRQSLAATSLTLWGQSARTVAGLQLQLQFGAGQPAEEEE